MNKQYEKFETYADDVNKVVIATSRQKK